MNMKEAYKSLENWLKTDEQRVEFDRLAFISVQVQGKEEYEQQGVEDGSIQLRTIVNGVWVEPPSPERQLIDRMTQYVLSVGLDFKGQSQCCYKAEGHQSGFSVQIDPAQLQTGIFSTEFTVSSTASLSTKTLIIAHRGPSSILEYTIPNSYMINCCIGRSWAADATAEVFAGISVSPGVSLDLNLNGINLSSQAEISAKAGAQVSLNAGAKHYYAEDYCPISNSDKLATRHALAQILFYGNYASCLKAKVVDFINTQHIARHVQTLAAGAQTLGFGWQHTVLYKDVAGAGPITAAGYFMRKLTAAISKDKFTPTNVIIASLDSGIAAEPTGEIKRQALVLRRELLSTKNKFPKDAKTYIKIVSYSATAEAGGRVEAEATLNLVGQATISAEAKLKFFNLTKTYKPVTVRFQAAFPAFKDASPETVGSETYVVMTQDTKIVYNINEFVPISFTAEVKAQRGNNAPDYQSAIENPFPEDMNWVFNTMNYTTTTAFWSCNGDTVPPSTPAKSGLRSSAQTSETRPLLPGSGISFGSSFDLKTLKKGLAGLEPMAGEIYKPKYILDAFSPDAEPIYEPPIEFISTPYAAYEPLNESGFMTQEITVALQDYDKALKENKYAYPSPDSRKAYDALNKSLADPKLGSYVAWLLGEATSVDPHFKNIYTGRPLNKQGGGLTGFVAKKLETEKRGRLYGLLEFHYAAAAAAIAKYRDEESRRQGVHATNLNAYVTQQKEAELQNKTANANIVRDNQAKKTIWRDNNERIDFQNSAIKGRNEGLKNGNRTPKLGEILPRDGLNYEAYIDFWRTENKKIDDHNRRVDSINHNKQKEWDKKRAYLQGIADQLHVDFDQIKAFFNDVNVLGLIECLESAVLLEASFRLKDFDVQVDTTHLRGTGTDTDTDTVAVKLKNTTSKTMLATFQLHSSTKELEAIRMRFRIRDSSNTEETAFKLGASVLGNGVKIEFKSIEEAGSEGIVDLATIWFARDFIAQNANTSTKSESFYEKAVPPVVLFNM